MDILVPLFWVVVIIIWIVSALARKQPGTSPEGEQPLAKGEGYRKPEEALERFLRRLSGEEEIRVAPLNLERETPLPPRIEEERVAPPQVKAEEPVYKMKLPEKKEEMRLPLPGTLDIPTIRQGIILSEILGPPRAERPL